jgi:hypothetical protein
MTPTPGRKFTLNDLRAARQSGTKVAVLTCYDSHHRTPHAGGRRAALLVGDSAANVILGHATTSTGDARVHDGDHRAVRRGGAERAPRRGHAVRVVPTSAAQGVRNVVRMSATALAADVSSKHDGRRPDTRTAGARLADSRAWPVHGFNLGLTPADGRACRLVISLSRVARQRTARPDRVAGGTNARRRRRPLCWSRSRPARGGFDAVRRTQPRCERSIGIVDGGGHCQRATVVYGHP